MPAPYSTDLRERIVEAYKSGKGSARMLAKMFDVGKWVELQNGVKSLVQMFPSSKIGLFFADLCRSFSSISIYLSVIALEL